MRTHPLSTFTGAGHRLASRSKHLVALCGAVAAGLAAVVFGFPVIPAAWATSVVTPTVAMGNGDLDTGAFTTYTVSFAVSSSGGFTTGNSNDFTLDASTTGAGTVFPAAVGDYTVEDCGGSVAPCASPVWKTNPAASGVALSNSNATATLKLPAETILNSDNISIAVGVAPCTNSPADCVENPTTAAAAGIDVSTFQDSTPVETNRYGVVAAQASAMSLACGFCSGAASNSTPSVTVTVTALNTLGDPEGVFAANPITACVMTTSSTGYQPAGTPMTSTKPGTCPTTPPSGVKDYSTPSLTFATTTAQVTFTYGDTTAKTFTLYACDTGNRVSPCTGTPVSATVNITGGDATQLAVFCPASPTACPSPYTAPVMTGSPAVPNLPFTVVAEDSFGNITTTGPAGQTSFSFSVTLATTSATGKFSAYSSGSCGTSYITTGSFSNVTTGPEFCYGDSAPASSNLTIADTTQSLTGTNTVTIAAQITAGAPSKLAISCTGGCPTTAPAQCAAAYSDGCPGTVIPTIGPFTITLQDSLSNPANCSGTNCNLTLWSSSSGTYSFTEAQSGECTGTVLLSGSSSAGYALDITSGQSSVTFCYADEKVQSAASPLQTCSGTGFVTAPGGLELCISDAGSGITSVDASLAINPAPVTSCPSSSPNPACGGAVAFLNGVCPGSPGYSPPISPGQISGKASFFADIPVCMQLTDQFGNFSGQDPAGEPVAPAGGVNESVFAYPSAPGAIVSATQYGSPTSSIQIPQGQSDVTFYYGDSNSGFDTVGAWGDVTQLGTSKGGVACGSVCGIGFGPGGLDATISPGTAVSNPTITPNPVTQSGTSTYTVAFQTSSSTSSLGCGSSYNLCGSTVATKAGDVIELDASAGAAGTYFPTNPADYTVGVTGGAAPAQVALTPTMSHCTSTNPAPTDCTTVIFTVPVNAAAGAQVNVTIKDVTNPSSESTQDYMNVATSTDSQSVQSVYYAITNGTGQNMTIIGSPAQSTDLGTPFGSPFEVKLTDASGNPIVNTSVTFCDGTYSPTTTTCTPASGAGGTFQSSGSYVETDQTNASGIAQASQFSANQVNGSYSVSANAFGFAPATFSLTNGASVGVSTERSAAVANPSSVPADGISTSIITVTLVNGSGVPLEGKTVTLASSSTFAKIVPLLPVTNAQGQATFSVSDTHDEPVTFTATDTTDSEVVNELAEVTFGKAAVLTVSPTCGTTGTGVTNYCVVFQTPQPVGKTSPPESITFTNSGSAILTVTGVTVGGYDQNDFQPAPGGTCGLQLEIGQSCTFNLQFTPQGTCTRQASLQISYNGLGSPVTIDAIGTGANADGSVPPDCASIPTVSSGGSGVGTQARGYWMDSADGGVYTFGGAGYFGSAGQLDPSAAPGGNNAVHLAAPIVGMASTPDGKGYWLVASDGGVFAFGDAGFFGSAGGLHLAAPIVGMASTPDGKGYWLVASDGGIFTYGDAGYFGSAGQLNPGATPGGTNSVHLAAPIVGMESTPDGAGYWLVASDGGVFAFGNAGFFGSVGIAGTRVVSMSSTSDGKGYWLLDAAGNVHPFGDAAFLGATGSPSSVLATVPGGSGSSGTGSQDYLIAGPTGAVVTFGAASYQGDAVGTPLAAPIVGLAPVE